MLYNNTYDMLYNSTYGMLYNSYLDVMKLLYNVYNCYNYVI